MINSGRLQERRRHETFRCCCATTSTRQQQRVQRHSRLWRTSVSKRPTTVCTVDIAHNTPREPFLIFLPSTVATDSIVFVRFFFSANTITHEPLHSARRNFAATARNPENFKVIGQRSRSHGFFVCFCVHDTAATRGQYLALGKAWRSSYEFVCLIVERHR